MVYNNTLEKIESPLPMLGDYPRYADSCSNARDFLQNFIRWSTFCEKYQPEHCELAAEIVRRS